MEGPPIEARERVLVVEDVVTSGGSLVAAIERVREEGIEIAGALAVLDRLAGGRDAIERALGDGTPYVALLTIDDVYPDRPDRAGQAERPEQDSNLRPTP
ncbi:MAG: phosphoribosyltransferase family protein [Solirubrobacterales bacterium]